MNKVCAFAPATIANLNVGFDVLGMALQTLGDKVEVHFNGTEKNAIIEIENDPNVPYETSKNCCSGAIFFMQEQLDIRKGVDIRIKKGFASGSGLGSSSASSAAAVFAFNELMGIPFTKKELIACAAEGERIACGTAHKDNVAPALLGGLVLIHEEEVISLPVPKNLYVVVCFPHTVLTTSALREVLDRQINLDLLSKQLSSMGAFVAGIYRNDLDLFSASMRDWIIEPARKKLIPQFDTMKKQAMDDGALSFGISGSGPSVFAFTGNEADAHTVCAGLEKIIRDSGIESETFVEPLCENRGSFITKY